MSSPHVVVLGGGVGGVVATDTLRRRLPSGGHVTLVDQSPVHEFKPTFLRLLTGESSPEEATEPLGQLEGPNVSFLQAEVTAIDTEEGRVETGGEPLSYDYLIVALGARYEPGRVPGLEAAHHVYTADAAQAYREALSGFEGGDLTLGVSRLPYICPAAPVEAALVTDHFLRKRGVREETTMRFFFPGPAPMKKAGDNVAQMAIRALGERDIQYHGEKKLGEVDSDAGQLHFEDGGTLPFDLLFTTPPHAGPRPVSQACSGLADDSGWIPVDRHTMQTDVENVYAVGDNAKVMIPSIGKPLPKAGVFARKQAEVAARNIASEVRGRGQPHRFDGVGQCFLVSRYGLNGQASMVEADFFADPAPKSEIKAPRVSRLWHWGKHLYERSWHRKWFPAEGKSEANPSEVNLLRQ